MSQPRVKALFDLPESIHRIGFVEVLSDAITRPQQTAQSYVVTPAIGEAFDKALRLVGTSLRDGRSQATFLHGSFGSGKSHFMALLSLMLDGEEAVWRIPELHPLRPKYAWVGHKQLLKLHFHMIGGNSLEEAIFLRYLAYARQHHPDATVPGLFADEKLFDDARRHLDALGDEAFFAPLNQYEADRAAPDDAGPDAGAHAGADASTDEDDDTDEWGAFVSKSHWDRGRFELAAASTDPTARELLFSALVQTHYRAYAEESRQFLDLDTGLGVIARHAKQLGYHGVVLFLDELILWLASRASDVAWFHNEVQKMVKLVEAQDAHREVPFISFIARQRDLSEMVGEDFMGMEHKLVRDSLKWSEGRYETITLGDDNLPHIVEKRILKPVDEAARSTLDDAFVKLRKGAAAAWDTMLGKLDAADFRRLYPFSPALVDALVALSNSLQRERTAIKLLTEILVEHIEDLALGDVVAVGDLYDVLAGGEDHADGVMRARFESAKQMYNYRFLPMLQEQHHATSAERCQRLRPEHPARLGCSNCTLTACRTDNRLVKTLIIAALVPEVAALKDMRASKLAQLNHGSLRVPIPGTETNLVTQKLRTWASQIGQLHVGDQADPTVRLELEGVELGPILEQARGVDNHGARQKVLRDLLFDSMGVAKIADWGKDDKREWRKTKRLGHIRFGNVRRMGPEVLRCPEGHDWRLIVDYPFDEPGFGPHDDEQVLEQFIEEHGGSWTLVLLPSFFSHSINQMLGELVVLLHILENNATTRRYVAHLNVDQQQRAQNDLTNLRTQKQSRITRALEQAYGLATPREGDLDGAQTVDKHLVALMPGAIVQHALAANLATVLDSYVPALLEARYPRHPNLSQVLTNRRIEELVARFGDIVDTDDKRIAADRTLVEEMRGTLGELGLVRVTETAVHLLEDRLLQELDKKRNQQNNQRPEVAEVRRWIDPGGKMGLQDEALDLVVRCYARWAARTFVSGDQAYQPVAGKTIPDYVALEKPDLPDQAQWVAALNTAGSCLGISLAGRALHADNLKRFETRIHEVLKQVAGACTRLPLVLQQRLAQLGLAGAPDRLETARSAEGLCAVLSGKAGKAQAEVLAGYVPETSARAVGQSIAKAEEVVRALDDNLVFGAFEQLQARRAELEGAAELLDKVAAVLRQDELNQAAAMRVRQLAEQAQRLVNPPPAPGRVVFERRLQQHGREAVLAQLQQALEQARAALDSADGDISLSGQIRIVARGGKGGGAS